jgi:hypothetical protein
MPGMNSRDVKVKDVSTRGGLLTVSLSDGRILSLPLDWYPSLKKSSVSERSLWRRSGGGSGIHWPALDYDLDVEGLLLGAKEMPQVLAFTRRFRALKRQGRRVSTMVFDPRSKLARV